MLSNYSLFDILATFDYQLKYSDSQYAVFRNNDHLVYAFQHNDRLQFCDNDFAEGDKVVLFGRISSTLPSQTDFKKHSYKVSITDSISPELLKTRMLAVKKAETVPANTFLRQVLFESPSGEDKVILYKEGCVVNTITIHPDKTITPLNSTGSHSKIFEGSFEFIRLYTSEKFIEDYQLNDNWEDPFLYVYNPSDIRLYSGLETYLTGFQKPSIIPSNNFINDVKLYTALSAFYNPEYSLSFSDVKSPSIVLKASDRKELKKFTNKIQRKFLKLKNELLKEFPGMIDLKGIEFYYYADMAFFPFPKSLVFQQYIFSLIQEALKLPIQIVDIQSKTIENLLLENFSTKQDKLISDEA